MGDSRMNEITEKITVKREKFDKIVDIVNRDNLEEISFEFVVGSCFPQALENIKDALKQQHAFGFAAGLQAAAEDNQLLNKETKAD